MNTERPIYEKRTFYGPLEIAADLPQDKWRSIMKHPDDPSKLIRVSGEGAYWDQDEMDESVYATQQVIKGLSKHGIHHVNPSYIDATDKDGRPHLLAVVTRLSHVQPYESLLLDESLDTDQIREIDQTLTNMLAYATQVMEEGGYIDPEIMRLEQFAYDASQTEGKRMILVDIESLGSVKVDVNKNSIEHGYPPALASTIIKLGVDAINLANKVGQDYTLTSLQKATDTLEALPENNSSAIDDAKIAFAHALDALRQP